METAIETASALGRLAEQFVFERQCSGMVEAAAKEAVRLNPRCAQAYYVLAIVAARDDGRLAEAVAAARQAIALEPGSAPYHYRLALILHERTRQLANAETAYRRALELKPDDPYYYVGLIGLLISMQRSAEAMTLALRAQPLLEAAANWYGLSVLNCLLGKLEAAWEYFVRAASGSDFDVEWASIDPDLGPLRARAEFETLIQRARSARNLSVRV